MSSINGIIIMIDMENVGITGLIGWELLSKNDDIYFFVNEEIKLKKNNIQNLIDINANIICRKLVKVGKNGIDFYIASEIGYIRGLGETRPIVIISNDNGYKAIVDYWNLRTKAKIHLACNIEKAFKICFCNKPKRYEEIKKFQFLMPLSLFQKM